jgi:hypothetical protein
MRDVRLDLVRGSGDIVKKSQTIKTDMKSKAARSPVEKTMDVPAPPTAGLQPVDLKRVREEIRNLVGNHAVGMVGSTIKDVENGHYLAMKYLFEMVGLCPAINSDHGVEEEADSLAKILLERLNILEKSTEVTGEGVGNGARLESDTVK